ncbi:GTPase [Embleya hyalina]|uniref:ATP-binding protein n=1 Tax=Embleya hyalina TaxID=516124 RepID=A0A401Z2A6_9ACTN|nr:GTPase [Embleya hyalina]GCE00918.1 ATP-binding protein [Embleya hyalina]
MTAGGEYLDRFAVRRARQVSETEESARLTARSAALDRAVRLARDRLPGAESAAAEDLLGHVETRLATAGRHTVVALAGATGGGKSSLFNVLTGLRLADTGVRRPTTRTTLACAWDPDGAAPLLDLLGIEPRCRVARHGVLDAVHAGGADVRHGGPGARRGGGMPAGLILLDLPDHDSIDLAHRAEVDALVAVADYIVWVLDPQKYADALLHDRYLRVFRHHARGMTVVLNHADRLPVGDLAACLTDVRALLVADGLAEVRVLATSPETGLGIAELRRVVAGVSGSGEASVARLGADLDALVERLEPYFAGVVPGVEVFAAADRDALVGGLCDAAGVGVVAAAEGERVRTARASSWRRARRPVVRVEPVQVHRAEQAIRRAGATLSRGMPAVWVGGVHRALAEGLRVLPDEVDAALVGAVPQAPPPTRGARVAAGARWIGAVAVIAGLLGVGLAATGVPVARWFGLPVAAWVAFAGLVVGASGAWCGWRAAVGAAERRVVAVEVALRARMADVADRVVVGPGEAEVARYRQACAEFGAAREGDGRAGCHPRE